MTEHRWGPRVHLDVPAAMRSVWCPEAEASVRNASLSGAFVETRERLPLLSRVAIRPLGYEASWMEASVTRVENDGIALEWLEPGSELALALASSRHRTPTACIADATHNER